MGQHGFARDMDFTVISTTENEIWFAVEDNEETKKKALILSRALKHGAAGENRTHDPVLTKDVRYHYATAALVGGYFNAFLKKVKYKIRKKEK